MGKSSNLPSGAFRQLAELSGEGLCLVNPGDLRTIFANPAVRVWAGIASTSDTLRQLYLEELLPEIGTPQREAEVEQLANGQMNEVTFTGLVRPANGKSLIANVRIQRVAAATESNLLAVVISPLPSSVGSGQARRDPLTGLADRTFLLDRLTSLLESDRARDRHCAVLFVDVDGFKQVNDSFGHMVGDRVLCEIARRLATCVRGEDHVARYGGDEFVVLLESVRGDDEIQPVVRRIQAALDDAVELPQGRVQLAVSIGVAEATDNEGTAEAIINSADRAMYAAKRAPA